MLYPKINTLWKRDPNNNFAIIEGDFSCPEFENIERWHVTEKIDGEQVCILWDGKQVRFLGKKDTSIIRPQLVQYLTAKFTDEFLKDKLTRHMKAHLFCEGYGASIQKDGHLYRLDVGVVLFDVFGESEIEKFKKWFHVNTSRLIAEMLDIPFVPIFNEGPDLDLYGEKTLDQAIDLLKSRPKSLLAENERIIEGVVARPAFGESKRFFDDGTPIMWKLKVKDYERLEKIKNGP